MPQFKLSHNSTCLRFCLLESHKGLTRGTGPSEPVLLSLYILVARHGLSALCFRVPH
jgi:hypothetical protein